MTKLSLGDRVRILRGPFEGFNGTIEAIDDANQRARVQVHIFGVVPDPEFDLRDLIADPEEDDVTE